MEKIKERHRQKIEREMQVREGIRKGREGRGKEVGGK
jgi:hypothetical protein